MTEVSDWDSESLLENLLDCLPVYLSDGTDESPPVGAKTALIATPVLLEELLTRHEKCHNDLYSKILALPKDSTYAQIAEVLKNEDSALVSSLVNVIGIVRIYEDMQRIDVSQLSPETRARHFQQLEYQERLVQAILEVANEPID